MSVYTNIESLPLPAKLKKNLIIIMYDSFSATWKKRTSTKAQDQTVLYLSIKSIFKQSTVCLSIQYHDRDDFFQDFYIKKILHGLKTGLAISSPHYDEMSIGALLHMMKQFKVNYYKQKNKSVATFSIDDAIQSSYNIQQTVEAMESNSSSVHIENYEHHSLNTMIDKAIRFITSSEKWVYILILKSATHGKVSLVDENSSKHYHWRPKLGLVLKGSYYNGAVSVDEYHEKTLIGQWSVKTYGDEIIPLSEYFLTKIFKSLHLAALSIYIQQEKK